VEKLLGERSARERGRTCYTAGVLLVPLMAALALSGGPDEIVAYHDSGDWARDTTRVVRRAQRYLSRRLEGRPAIVLDVDDTSLSTYECLKAVDFDRTRVSCGESGDLPAIAQTRRLYRYARRHGVAVFFVTGRRERMRGVTARNLRDAGFDRWRRLYLRPNREATRDGYKARTRARIERRGFDIVVNLGDQRSDLDGGHARRAFKLPNPMYVIEDA
jgi:putative acid phosphatase of HAD superfamily subfamily IIIB